MIAIIFTMTIIIIVSLINQLTILSVSMDPFAIVFLFVLIMAGASSNYCQLHAKQNIIKEQYPIVKIDNEYFKEYGSWKYLVLYKNTKTGKTETLICDWNEFKIKNGNSETLTMIMEEPIIPKWLRLFNICPVDSRFHYVAEIPKE